MERYEAAKRAGIVGIFINIVLLVLKTIVGFISNSQAMIADAFNSFGDVFSSLLTYIGNRISSQEADEDYNLGYGKAEYIFSFLISIILLITSFTVVKNAIKTYLNKDKIIFSYSLIIICIITIITKLALYLYTKKLNKNHKNILIEANSKDHRNDCFITTLTLVSSILGIYGYKIVDGIAGVLISLWILYSAIQIFIKSYDVLMDKSLNDDTTNKVYEIIKRHEEIKKVIHFNSTPVGYLYQISFTIFVDGNLTTFASHEIANKLEREIEKKIPEIYLSVIHVNPIKVDD